MYLPILARLTTAAAILFASSAIAQQHPDYSSVARIEVQLGKQCGPQGCTIGTQWGSGVVVAVDAKKAYLLTNRHVIAGYQRIIVRLPQIEPYAAIVVSEHSKLDLALIAIRRPPRIQPVRGVLRAIGRGVNRLFTAGYGRGRFHSHVGGWFRPNDVTIKVSGGAMDGDSGGPVFTEEGYLAGIVFGTGVDEDMTYAIAADEVWLFLRQNNLLQDEKPAIVDQENPPTPTPAATPQASCDCGDALDRIAARLDSLEDRLTSIQKGNADYQAEIEQLKAQIANMKPVDVRREIQDYVAANPITVKTYDVDGKPFDEPYPVRLGEVLPLRTIITNRQ